MRKIIITYIVSSIALVLARCLTYSMVGEMSLMTFAFINLLPPTLIITIANFIIQYRKKTSVKGCFLHAFFLALLSLTINMAATEVVGEQVIDNAIESEANQEIWDELDRLARQKMIEEGLITEDEIIYSEPYIGGNSGTNSEQLVGTWDVQIEKENALSMLTGGVLDIILSFVGGMLGMKLWVRRKAYSFSN